MHNLLNEAQKSGQTSEMLEFANVVKSTVDSTLKYKETLQKYAVISFWRFEND
jgi:hypothetical protein